MLGAVSTTRYLRSLALASLAVGAWNGCSPPQGDGEITQALFANDKTAFDFFVAKGLTSFQSAGIVGNLDQESGVDPNAVQFGGGPGRGIAQWSVGGRWDTTPNGNVVWYAKQKGQSEWSLNLQLEFIWYELTTFGYGFAELKATANVHDATIVFQDKYEICGACNSTQRIAYAQAVLNAYGATPSYSAKYVSQSWPLANMPLTIRCGEDVPANIVLRNDGAKSWGVNTKLGTTQPRDRASIFAAGNWLSPDRPSHATGPVAPNATFKFDFAFHGPTGNGCKPGDYHEFFGVVQEGVAWFSDPGQGGPPDNQIEAWIKLVPAPPGADMANGATDDMANGGTDDMANLGGGDMGNGGSGGGADLAGRGGGGSGRDGGTSSNDLAGNAGGSGVQGGCSTGGDHRASPFAATLGLLVACVWVRRRRS
jgi:uncharacterized protein (TIGR03382 family)